jgi:hypothetical protein
MTAASIWHDKGKKRFKKALKGLFFAQKLIAPIRANFKLPAPVEGAGSFAL